MEVSNVVLSAYQQAKKVQQNAYAPYSKFRVGSALKIKNHDEIIIGCNVENASFGATVCAERSAVLNAIAQFGKCELEFIVVVTDLDDPAVPCALCLQVLCQFAEQDLPIYLANNKSIITQKTLKDFLPTPFNSLDI